VADRGDPEHDRFKAMYDEHYPAVLRYAARRVGAEAARDIAAETFLTAWRRLDRVPPASRFPGSTRWPVNAWPTSCGGGSGYQVPLSAVGDPRRATHIPVRVIECTVTDGTGSRATEVFRLITTILDPDDLTAPELAPPTSSAGNTRYRSRRSRPRYSNPAAGSAPNPLNSSARNCGACCWPITRYAR
jgi:Sigma-70 region 2